MTLTDHVLAGSEVAVERDASRLEVGLPWYRSMPVSSVTGLQLRIGDRLFETGDLALDLDGAIIPVAELAGYTSRYWFLQDRLPVVVPAWSPPPEMEAAPVELRMRLQLPYLFREPGIPLAVEMMATDTLPVRRH
jgi:hypothetical protein